MWVGFLIGFIVGLVTGLFGYALATMGKKLDYEDKLWELEKLRMQYENRE